MYLIYLLVLNILTCTICNKAHPSSLHIPSQYSNDSSSAGKGSTQDRNSSPNQIPHNGNPSTHSNKSTHAVSHFSSYCDNDKCSMIIPVYISHEVLVYSVLDTQSDTSFILDDMLDLLDVKDIPVNLSLSTMGSSNQLIKSCRVSGVRVRGYYSDKLIDLPPTYTITFLYEAAAIVNSRQFVGSK